MAYAIADHLYDLWPGIDYYVFEAYRQFAERMGKAEHDQCRVCGASYLPQPGVQESQGPVRRSATSSRSREYAVVRV